MISLVEAPQPQNYPSLAVFLNLNLVNFLKQLKMANMIYLDCFFLNSKAFLALVFSILVDIQIFFCLIGNQSLICFKLRIWASMIILNFVLDSKLCCLLKDFFSDSLCLRQDVAQIRNFCILFDVCRSFQYFGMDCCFSYCLNYSDYCNTF